MRSPRLPEPYYVASSWPIILRFSSFKLINLASALELVLTRTLPAVCQAVAQLGYPEELRPEVASATATEKKKEGSRTAGFRGAVESTTGSCYGVVTINR
jgi:hypothetical protein